MRRTHSRLSLACLSVFLIPAWLFAQNPPSGPPPGAPAPGEHRVPPKPVNLQVLPKDTDPEKVIAIMHSFEGSLGVECSFCHVPDPAHHRLNFASDDKPEKASARLMMTMTNELNTKYVTQLPTGAGNKVTCGTCHRGHAMPEEFVPAPEKEEKR